MKALDELRSRGVGFYFTSFSALDRYFHVRPSGVIHVAVRCTLVELARTVSDLSFPAVDGIDALSTDGDTRACFVCLEDEGNLPERAAFPVLDLLYDPIREVFVDPHGVYGTLRTPELGPPRSTTPSLRAVMDAAVLVSRYSYTAGAETIQRLAAAFEETSERASRESPAAQLQRNLVCELFTAAAPWEGLNLLMLCGFIEKWWTVFAPMNATDQSKGMHPEGNVWVHSLETLRYRKTQDLTLSLGLFLHDCGKPYSRRKGANRFDGHAEIGARVARKFLSDLGFEHQLIADVDFLVKYHMIPAALKSLPTYRTDTLMASVLFPVLLEVYRCDLNSSFRGPAGYYEACKVYRTYLKNVHNPFRAADGRKLVQLYVQ